MFVLEQKHGFNKTTWRTYVADLAKGVALLFALAIPCPTRPLVSSFHHQQLQVQPNLSRFTSSW